MFSYFFLLFFHRKIALFRGVALQLFKKHWTDAETLFFSLSFSIYFLFFFLFFPLVFFVFFSRSFSRREDTHGLVSSLSLFLYFNLASFFSSFTSPFDFTDFVAFHRKLSLHFLHHHCVISGQFLAFFVFFFPALPLVLFGHHHRVVVLASLLPSALLDSPSSSLSTPLSSFTFLYFTSVSSFFSLLFSSPQSSHSRKKYVCVV